MAEETTLGRFVFEYVTNSEGLKKGNEEAIGSSEELARKIEKISMSNDNLARRMTSIAQVMAQAADASEWLAAKQGRAAETNEALSTSIDALTERFEDFTEAGKNAREEAEKNEKQRDSDGKGVSNFAKKLLALAAAYVSVNKIAGGFAKNFQGNLEIANFTELLDLNAASIKNWQNVLAGAGGDPGNIIETFKNIAIQLGELDAAGSGNQLLGATNKLGVKIKDETGENLDPDQILLNFADALQNKNLDKELALYVAGQFGISEDVLRLLNRGRSEIDSLLEEQEGTQYQLTSSDAESLQEFNKELQDVKQTADSLFSEIGLEYLNEAKVLLMTMQDILNDMRGVGPGSKTEEEFGLDTIGNHWLDRFNAFGQDLKKERDERVFQKDRANEEEFLQKNGQGVLDQMNKPQSRINPSAGAGGETTFDFSGMTIETQATNGEQLANELVVQVERVIGRSFTKASETLGNSVLG